MPQDPSEGLFSFNRLTSLKTTETKGVVRIHKRHKLDELEEAERDKKADRRAGTEDIKMK